ncbi:type III pantothenate kinase [Mycoplasma marinum]|uniref:Type III pantothenate kinase n=1 Tax=Mycoplasma marinum TaxID=1937190 RepID=A0A4R0XMC5_9MOLU|nr:type III pantothenate kinase [Mycoplasma marinum]TCG11859.1 hypothetical protein C4B24_00480 [Mycoplasma marinum]
MKLYFDIGNTNIKLNFREKEEEKYFSFKTKDENITIDSFFNMLPENIIQNNVEKVFITSVVPRLTSLMTRMVKKYFQIEPKILAFPIKTGLKINATDPKTIGADLIALSVFAASKSNNSIIINLGTSTTITHIENKDVKGFIIAPGIQGSFESLIDNAAKLPEINLNPIDKVLGNNTSECLSIGVLKGHSHMLKGFIREIDRNADIFISGGHSYLVEKYIPGIFIEEATIKGMKVLEELNGF